MVLQSLYDGFDRAFEKGAAPQIFYAPGRVNLIGEHIDYNGGFVFPCALTLGCYVAIRQRDDGIVNLSSGNFNLSIKVDLNNLAFNPAHEWANYPKAVVVQLMEAGYTLGGFDMYVLGDLPNGAGLSSSASITVATCLAMDTLFSLGIDPVVRAKLCQQAENHYIGVNCGIMDPFASTMARKEYAILLNCASLEYTFAPLAMGEYSLVIANTNKRRGLADSKYNERRAECESALADMKKVCKINALCDLSPEEFDAHKSVIWGDIERKRATHAVYENARTKSAVDALNKGDLFAFGQMMNESHISLRDLYEVTGVELDSLVEAAWDFGLNKAGSVVVGSRMTGAGFGGCTVSIVRNDATDNFIKDVGLQYAKQTGLRADFYIAQTDAGVREIV